MKTPDDAPKRGEHYQVGEIALIYLFESSPRSKEALAKLLGRTEGGIEMVYRWIEGAEFPKTAENEIKRHIDSVRENLGSSYRGILKA